MTLLRNRVSVSALRMNRIRCDRKTPQHETVSSNESLIVIENLFRINIIYIIAHVWRHRGMRVGMPFAECEAPQNGWAILLFDFCIYSLQKEKNACREMKSKKSFTRAMNSFANCLVHIFFSLSLFLFGSRSATEYTRDETQHVFIRSIHSKSNEHYYVRALGMCVCVRVRNSPMVCARTARLNTRWVERKLTREHASWHEMSCIRRTRPLYRRFSWYFDCSVIFFVRIFFSPLPSSPIFFALFFFVSRIKRMPTLSHTKSARWWSQNRYTAFFYSWLWLLLWFRFSV